MSNTVITPLFSFRFLSQVFSAVMMSVLFFAASSSFAEPSKIQPKQEVVRALVNLNTADAGMLEASLSGIGSKKALAIVAWRDANGGFKAIEELTLVKGIGDAILEKNRGKLTL